MVAVQRQADAEADGSPSTTDGSVGSSVLQSADDPPAPGAVTERLSAEMGGTCAAVGAGDVEMGDDAAAAGSSLPRVHGGPPAVGRPLAGGGGDDDSPPTLGTHDGRDLLEARRKLTRLWERCFALSQAGGLLRAYVGPASQYSLRLGSATTDTDREHSAELRQVCGELFGWPMSDQEWRRARLATKNGGLGVQLAEDHMNGGAWVGLTAALLVANRVLP